MEITSSVTELFWPHFPVQLYASLPFLFICSIIHLCHPETNPAGDQKGSKKWNRLELTLITSSKRCLCIVVVSFTMPVLDRQEESWTNLCEDHTFLTFAVFFFFFPLKNTFPPSATVTSATQAHKQFSNFLEFWPKQAFHPFSLIPSNHICCQESSGDWLQPVWIQSSQISY